MPVGTLHAEPAEAETLSQRFRQVRAASLALTEGLSESDAQVQSMPDASPAKWHLAHTTWFFETVVLEAVEAAFKPHHPAYRVLFNSYYHGIGAMHARAQRGLVTRPGLAEVLDYRRAVDARVMAWLMGAPTAEALSLLELGLQHEQQHQELILTDLLHLLSCNPLQPACRRTRCRCAGWNTTAGWCRSATRGPVSPSTTRPRGIASGLTPFR